MIELAQHIEVLLLENDCVIVPGLGGFVAHYTPAMRVAEENTFLPPTRIIGFNPQLKMNDGLLVQSYMAVYGTDFSDATRIVDKSVKELLSLLHETVSRGRNWPFCVSLTRARPFLSHPLSGKKRSVSTRFVSAPLI